MRAMIPDRRKILRLRCVPRTNGPMQIRTKLGLARTVLYGVWALTLACVATGCAHDWETDYRRLHSQHQQTVTDLAGAEQRIAELEAQNQELHGVLVARGRDITDMRSLREGLQRDLEAARARERQQQERLQALRNMARQF